MEQFKKWALSAEEGHPAGLVSARFMPGGHVILVSYDRRPEYLTMERALEDEGFLVTHITVNGVVLKETHLEG